jgi:hypothetical protein
MSDLYIGAYWGPRQESVAQCAERLMACLERLHDCDEVFSQWFEKGKSRKDALSKPFEFRAEDNVLRLLEASRHRHELDRSVMDDLGFMVGLWNGGSDVRSTSLSVTCGSYIENLNLRNSVVLDLPEELGGLADKDHCVQVLKCVAETWEPDWAGVISRTSRNARSFNPAVPFVDWMVYINQIGIFPAGLPATATKLELTGKGTVVIVQDHPIDPYKPADLSNVNAVSASLSLTEGTA